MMKFGISTSQLHSIQLYNNFCLNNIKKLANSAMGINFYIEVCLLLSKWLCVMGFSKEILRVKSKSPRIEEKCDNIISWFRFGCGNDLRIYRSYIFYWFGYFKLVSSHLGICLSSLADMVTLYKIETAIIMHLSYQYFV